MNARLERKLRTLTVVVISGVAAGLVANFMQGRTSATSMMMAACTTPTAKPQMLLTASQARNESGPWMKRKPPSFVSAHSV